MEVKGLAGASIELLENKVVIKRSGFLHAFNKSTKEIFLDKISSIQLKKPSMMNNGYIQFVFSGGNEVKETNPTDLFHTELLQDENTVFFKKKQEKDFEALKMKMEEIILKNKENSKDNYSSSNYLDELERLANLKDRGIITEEEFNAKKKQILGL